MSNESHTPDPESGYDIHLHTVDTNEDFQRYMDTMDRFFNETVGWRQRLTRPQQRQYAKVWAFGRLYGTQEITEIINKIP